MKVLFFCNLVPKKTGAFERLLTELGHIFRMYGDALCLALAGEPSPTIGEGWRAAGTRWVVVKGWVDALGREKPWGFVPPALRLLGAEKPDVAAVHFGDEIPALVAAMLASRGGARTTKWVWQQDQQVREAGWLTRRLSRLRLLSFFFDRFVAVYEGGKCSLERRGITSERIRVISNSVADAPCQRSPGWLKKELGLRGDSVLAVSVSALIPRKRVDWLIRALAATSQDSPVLHLAVAGEGHERERLVSLAAKLGVAERTHWLGLRDDVREILAEADYVVHASEAEGACYALVETMCAARAIVTTDAGAAREQVEDGVTGFVTRRDDFDAFAACVRKLKDDSALRQRMGSAARKRWQERYRVENAARAYHALYRELASGCGAGQEARGNG